MFSSSSSSSSLPLWKLKWIRIFFCFLLFFFSLFPPLNRLPLAVATTPFVANTFRRKQDDAAAADSASEEKKPMGKLALAAKTNQKVQMIKEYGSVFLVWWYFLWAVSWGGMYLALDNGLIGGQDGMELLAQVPYIENFIDLPTW